MQISPLLLIAWAIRSQTFLQVLNVFSNALEEVSGRSLPPITDSTSGAFASAMARKIIALLGDLDDDERIEFTERYIEGVRSADPSLFNGALDSCEIAYELFDAVDSASTSSPLSNELKGDGVQEREFSFLLADMLGFVPGDRHLLVPVLYWTYLPFTPPPLVHRNSKSNYSLDARGRNLGSPFSG